MIIGNMGRKPEMRYTPRGDANTTVTVAVTRRYKTAEGEAKEDTEWFNVVAWRKLGEVVSAYGDKGRKVYVEGELRTRSWQGTDGQTHYRTELVANDVQFLDSRKDTAVDDGDGELPF